VNIINKKRLRSLRRGGVVAVTLLTTAGLLAACGSSSKGVAGSGGAITVCGDLALSGPYTQLGQTDNWGAEAYFKSVNAHGGIDGHKFKYTVLDNQSQPAQAALIAQKCIRQNKAAFIVGPESGADTESALPIAIANKTILISLSSGWQSNGYKSSELNSFGFPGFYDVFYQDQLASVKDVILPQHMTRVALINNACGPVCTANTATVQQLAKQYHFQVVGVQTVPLDATDITPQVLTLLNGKPQIVLFGLVPGPPSITAIRAIRSQDPNIPISECSACELPSFVSAAGGASNMQHIYVLGSMQTWLQNAEQGSRPVDKATATGLKAYFAGMKVAGFNSENQIDNSQPGWDAGLQIGWAVKTAGKLDETTIMHTLQHFNINTLGIVWNRTPQNYENISQVDAAMETIKPDGTATLYKGGA
jgi:ABC-type branched-subunit amino acid transport system substrate-binding protein